MGEYCEVYQIDSTKARKPHKCVGCWGLIPTGEIYKRHHGVYDGSGFSMSVCLWCDSMLSELKETVNPNQDFCFSVEEIKEAVFEGGDVVKMKGFIENREKRGAVVPVWMRERVNDNL